MAQCSALYTSDCIGSGADARRSCQADKTVVIDWLGHESALRHRPVAQVSSVACALVSLLQARAGVTPVGPPDNSLLRVSISLSNFAELYHSCRC